MERCVAHFPKPRFKDDIGDHTRYGAHSEHLRDAIRAELARLLANAICDWIDIRALIWPIVCWH